MHERLRAALRLVRETAAAVGGVGAVEAGDGGAGIPLVRDLLTYCHGFCTALDGHHRGEDGRLFPDLAGRHPSLRPVIDRLAQDHRMIAHLVGELEHALERSPAELSRHLDGLAAIMESHFRYEERQLLDVLARLDLDAEPADVLGPL